MEPKVGEQLCSWWAQVSAAERESTSESARSTTGDVGNASSCCASVGFVFTFSLSCSLSLSPAYTIIANSTEQSFLAVGQRLSSVLERLLAELVAKRGTLLETWVESSRVVVNRESSSSSSSCVSCVGGGRRRVFLKTLLCAEPPELTCGRTNIHTCLCKCERNKQK